VVGYAAAHLGRWHVDRGLLLRCLALYTIFNAVVNLVTRQGIWDKARGRAPPLPTRGRPVSSFRFRESAWPAGVPADLSSPRSSSCRVSR
jgi:hypothetical protein